MATAKKIFMGAAIAIMLVLFIGFFSWQLGKVFVDYPEEPEEYYGKDCYIECGGLYEPRPVEPINGKDMLNQTCYDECNEESQALWEQYREEQQEHRDVVALIALIMGLIAIIIGVLINKNITVAGGLIAGGAMGLVYATILYWQRLGDWFRVIIIGAVVIILIFLAYKFVKDK